MAHYSSRDPLGIKNRVISTILKMWDYWTQAFGSYLHGTDIWEPCACTLSGMTCAKKVTCDLQVFAPFSESEGYGVSFIWQEGTE